MGKWMKLKKRKRNNVMFLIKMEIANSHWMQMIACFIDTNRVKMKCGNIGKQQKKSLELPDMITLNGPSDDNKVNKLIKCLESKAKLNTTSQRNVSIEI